VWPSLILVLPTTCFRTSLRSYPTSAFSIYRCGWGTIPTFLFWAVALQSFLSTANESSSVIPSTSLA
jgi:hypothetical protein